jgi:Ras-related protein Rab-8A
MARAGGYKPSYDETVKILLIGESSVGKSSLLIRFAEDSFSPELLSTVGIDYKIKTLEIKDKRVKMEIWDTAGQERFRTITTAYYRGATGIMLVYDVTSEKSFKQINEWLKLIDKHASENVVKILVANKCDVSGDKRVVSRERAQAQADEFGLKTMETSALSGLNVEDVFFEMGKLALERIESEKEELLNERNRRDNGVKIDNNGGGKNGGGNNSCCK